MYATRFIDLKTILSSNPPCTIIFENFELGVRLGKLARRLGYWKVTEEN